MVPRKQMLSLHKLSITADTVTFLVEVLGTAYTIKVNCVLAICEVKLLKANTKFMANFVYDN